MPEVVEKVKQQFPSLRFSGFKGNWTKRALGEVCTTFKSGEGITAEHINEEGEYPVYGGNGLRGYTDSFTHEGVYVLIGRQGALCGNVNVVNGKSYISEHAIAVSGNELADTEWLGQKLGFVNLNRLSESSAQPGLAVNKLVKLEYLFPTLPEQQKIAAFLGAVDRKIQQLKRKQELLERYKKGVVQELFPSASSGQAPELRFTRKDGSPTRGTSATESGEYPEWEEKRLGDVVTFTKGKGVSKGDIVEGGATKCIRYGELYTTYGEVINDVVSSTNVDPSQLLLSKKNDVIIPASGETQLDIAKAACVMHDGIALGGDLNVMRTKENGVFLAYYLNGAKRNAIAEMAQGNSVVHLYAKQLQGISIQLPSLEEQSRIAGFLMALDAKVAGVAQAVAAAQKWKKGLLQQMFV